MKCERGIGEAQLMLDEINGNWTVGELKYPFGNGVNFQIDIEDIKGFVHNIIGNCETSAKLDAQ